MKKSLKWLSKQTKRSLSLLVILTFGVSLMSTDAQARLIFTTETDGVEVNSYSLDVDGSVNLTDNTDLSLNFGANLGASLTYNDSTSQFTFNKNVNLSNNELKSFLVENSAAAPAVCSAALEGRMYQNTTDNNLYYCNGTVWKLTSSLGAGSVTSTEIADGTIVTVDLADNSVTSAKIATGAVTTAEILDGTIASVDIAADTITAGNIAIDAVTASELANNAVDTTAILDGAVTSAKILDGTIATADLADDSITAAKIASATAGNDKVLTTDVTGANVWVDKSTFGTSALTSAQIFVGNVSGVATGVAVSGDVTLDNTGNFQLAASSVTTAEILDGTIVAADIATGAVTTAEILDGTIASADIAADTITAGNIAIDAVTASELANNAVDTTAILDGAVTSAKILDGTIASADIAANTITAGNIATGAVTTAEILDGTIATADLADDSITAAKIASATAGNDKVLTTDVTGANVWVDKSTFGTSALTSAQIFVGNVSGVATGVAVSGDVTLDNTGNFQLAASSVTTAEILDGTIVAADIATGAVTTAEILDGTIGTVDIANDAITTAKIAADTILAADIATGAVTTDEILDNTIALVDIAERNATDVVPPEYPNFTLTADGTANRGTFESDYDAVNKRNYYKWSTRKTVIQDYDMVVQWPIPENFQGFQAVNPFQFDFKTTNAVTADNKIDIVSILGTDGLTVTPTGSTAALTSTTWTTGNVQFGGGTFTPGQYITINFKLSARNNGTKQASQLGALKFNYLAK